MSKAHPIQDPTLRFSRCFTRAGQDAYADIHFTTGSIEDSSDAFLYPAHWPDLSVTEFRDAAIYSQAPTRTKPVEENTTPSWLWRHMPVEGTPREPENDAALVFDRVAGSAAYTGWHEGLFHTEEDARTFFDECRAALAQKQIIIAPAALRLCGIDWAYGISERSARHTQPHPTAPDIYQLSNAMIDGMIGGRSDAPTWKLWNKVTRPKAKSGAADIVFGTTETEWSGAENRAAYPAPMLIDLLWHRHMDGSVNAESLRQATRLLVTLADLLGLDDHSHLCIGFGNLAPLLTAMGLPYDSEAARATASAITAIMTAEAHAASARLAALRGISPSFQQEREIVLRAMRNHHRAVYDEQNDYEKLSVLPQPLSVGSGIDLSLAATARTAWDRAEQLVNAHGLRFVSFTGMALTPSLRLFAGLQTLGVEPTPTLLDDTDLHPTVMEALTRLSLSSTATRAVRSHVCGHRSLVHAPVINHATLRNKGFDAASLQRIEESLQGATTLRQVFTPWVLSTTFCVNNLGLSPTQLDNPAFNLLEYLGFGALDVVQANHYCFGANSMKDAPHLTQQQKSIFVTASDLRSDALIRMAGAVQGFMSGSTGLMLSLATSTPPEQTERLLLTAWRAGLRNLRLIFDAELPVHTRRGKKVATSAIYLQKQPKVAIRRPKKDIARYRAPQQVVRLKDTVVKKDS